ncbi:MAG: hypothetical protein C0608_04115 [Deltaproteobacteria bacterium]|nr:MAG: hypothetical protein C0608_04115 [Deltaproteobacteria bacterium]
MGAPIVLELDPVTLSGTLNDTAAAKELELQLPIYITMTRWGEEYYGTLLPPLGEVVGDEREVLEVGELAYWHPGDALCLFFGPTPASEGDEPRAASPVVPLGKVSGDWGSLSLLGAKVEACIALEEGAG